MAGPISRSSNGLPLVQLRAYERLDTVVDDGCTKLAHVMLLRGPSAELVAHLPTAFMHALNLHPRIRALQVREPAQHSEIQPLLTLEDVTRRRLLRIGDTSSQEEDQGIWKTHIEEEAMRPFDRYQDLPVFLEVWVDREEQFTRLFLFSDHYMSDGVSGRAILNDTLTRVAQLSRGEVVEPKELPLRKGPYNMMMDPYTFSTPLSEFAVRMLYNVVRKFFCTGKPLIPIRSDQTDFAYPYKVNWTYAKFDSGEPEALKRALGRCKEHGTTLTGASIAAMMLAHYHVSQKYNKVEFNQPFKVAMGVSVDMRARWYEKTEEQPIGNYSSLVTIDPLRYKGVKLESKFWDAAKKFKTDIEAAINGPLMALTDICLDQFFEAEALPKTFVAPDYAIPQSFTGDATFANIGQYPYAMSHSLGSGKKLEIDSLHFYESVPGIAMGSVLLLSTTDKVNYGFAHKYEDEDADALFRSILAFSEHIGEVESDSTLADVYSTVKAKLEAA